MAAKLEYSLLQLIDALGDECYGDQAVQILVHLTSTLIERLAKALNNPECAVREKAVFLLGEIGEKTAKTIVPALVPLLGDPDEIVGQKTAQALTRIGKSAIPALIWALQSDDIETRFYAATSLADFPEFPIEPIPSLIEALIDASNDPHCGVRFVAEEVLKALGTP